MIVFNTYLDISDTGMSFSASPETIGGLLYINIIREDRETYQLFKFVIKVCHYMPTRASCSLFLALFTLSSCRLMSSSTTLTAWTKGCSGLTNTPGFWDMDVFEAV